MTKPILSDPRHGWATLILPTENNEQPFIANISYVTDIMFDALSAYINYLDNEIAAVKFNPEVTDMQRQTFQKLETILRTSMAIRTEVYTYMKGDNHED